MDIAVSPYLNFNKVPFYIVGYINCMIDIKWLLDDILICTTQIASFTRFTQVTESGGDLTDAF